MTSADNLKSHFSKWLFCLALVFTLWGCEHVGPLETELAPEEETPKLSQIQTSVLDTSCALSGCHMGPNALLGLDLSSGVS